MIFFQFLFYYSVFKSNIYKRIFLRIKEIVRNMYHFSDFSIYIFELLLDNEIMELRYKQHGYAWNVYLLHFCIG